MIRGKNTRGTWLRRIRPLGRRYLYEFLTRVCASDARPQPSFTEGSGQLELTFPERDQERVVLRVFGPLPDTLEYIREIDLAQHGAWQRVLALHRHVLSATCDRQIKAYHMAVAPPANHSRMGGESTSLCSDFLGAAVARAMASLRELFYRPDHLSWVVILRPDSAPSKADVLVLPVTSSDRDVVLVGRTTIPCGSDRVRYDPGEVLRELFSVARMQRDLEVGQEGVLGAFEQDLQRLVRAHLLLAAWAQSRGTAGDLPRRFSAMLLAREKLERAHGPEGRQELEPLARENRRLLANPEAIDAKIADLSEFSIARCSDSRGLDAARDFCRVLREVAHLDEPCDETVDRRLLTLRIHRAAFASFAHARGPVIVLAAIWRCLREAGLGANLLPETRVIERSSLAYCRFGTDAHGWNRLLQSVWRTCRELADEPHEVFRACHLERIDADVQGGPASSGADYQILSSDGEHSRVLKLKYGSLELAEMERLPATAGDDRLPFAERIPAADAFIARLVEKLHCRAIEDSKAQGC